MQEFLNIDDFVKMSSSYVKEVARTANIILDLWDAPGTQNYIEMLNRASNHAISSIPPNVNIDLRDLKSRLVDSIVEKLEDLYPIPIYISASIDDPNTVGLLFYLDGHFDMFEGSDEASLETYEIANQLLQTEQKYVLVYGNHRLDTVEQIREKRTLPAGLFVSPLRSHAEAHWDLDAPRALVIGKVLLSSLMQISDIDWKTTKETPIKNLRIIF